MLILAAIGGGAFVLASLVVSLRLLALARRSGELPELLIGLGLLLMGGIGYPLSTVARLLESAPSLQASLFGFHALLSLVGQGCVAVFTWRVFRSAEPWARGVALGFVATLAALLVWQTADPGWRVYAATQGGPWAWLPLYSLFVLAWAGVESLLYHLKLRKRLAIGLADPVTSDRLRLWALAMLAAFTTSLVAVGLRSVGIQMTAELTGLVVGPLGLVSATAMWLAFMPPERYVSWILARAGARV